MSDAQAAAPSTTPAGTIQPSAALADPPGMSNKPPRGGAAGADPFSRLEAAGIDDAGDEYEDLSELGIEPAKGKSKTEPADPDAELDEELAPEADPDEPKDVLGLNGKGTREQPLRHKDLPADKFVELKTADGKRVVVSLKDAVSGAFMSRDMVDRHVSTAKETVARAKQLEAIVSQRHEQNVARVNAMLSDPIAIVKYFVQHNEKVLEQAAVAYAKLRGNPQLRMDLMGVIRRESLDAQERQVQQRRQAIEQQENDAREYQEVQREIGPGYRQGLKDAGLLAQAKNLPEEVQEEIRMRFEYVRSKNGGKVTAEQMRACVVSGAKAAGYPKSPAARPAPVPPPAEATPRPAAGKRNWDDVPRELRMRDVDYLFRRRG